MSLAATLLALAPSAPALRIDEGLERGWRAVRTDLELLVDPARASLRVEGTLVARLEGDDASPGPVLLLNTRDALMRFEAVSVPGAPGVEVALNEEHAERESARLARLRFDEPRLPGAEVEVRFACVLERSGRQLVASARAYLGSWVEGWYPFLAGPEGASLSGATRVPGTTTFHLPPGWHAVSNGELLDSVEDAAGTIETWEAERALSRSFAAGPYIVIGQTVGELDVSLFLLSDDLPDPEAHVRALGQAIAAMEERWGPYPYPSYAIAEVPMGSGDFGASSEQGFILVKPNFLRVPDGNLPLFAHEAAHGWWGNAVGTTGSGGMFGTESLAQYGAVLAAEGLWGQAGATELLRFSRPGYIANQCARGYFELLRAGLDKPLAELASGGHPDHTLADAKGHWVHHMLRRRVGDEVFFATVRALIAAYDGKAMSLDDWRAAFRRAAPEARLEVFFEQWYERTGAPVLRAAWDDAGDALALTIEQLQEGEPFDLELDVALELADGGRLLERVHLAERRQTFALEGTGEVARVRLDPDHALLLWSPDLGPAPVPGLEDREPEAPALDAFEACLGTYDVAAVGVRAVVFEEDGHPWLALGERDPVRLIHTGERRFRAPDGFVVFEGDVDVGDDAPSFRFLRDQGGERLATRID